MKEKKESKRERRMREEGLSESLPMNIAMGWVEQSDGRKDIVDLAKGHIDSRFTAKDASWYAIQPFMGGWFWEAHEGGPGKGYLGPVIAEMTANQGGEYWVPAGSKKVLKIMMRDGKPFPIILSEAESLKVRNSGQAPLIGKSRMTRFASRGTGMFVFGAALAAMSCFYMLATMGFYLSVWQPGPMVRAVDLAQLPHSQWGKVENTDPEHIVSKLEMKGGVWQAPDVRRHIITDLEKERQNGREINASFDKRNFGFEAKSVGDKIAPVAPPTVDVNGTAAKTEAPPKVTTPATPSSVPPATSPATAPSAPVQATVPVQPTAAVTPSQPIQTLPGQAQPAPQPSATNANGPGVEQGVERQQRVMEQLRQLRERNAAAQGKAGNAATKVGETAPTPPATTAITPVAPAGDKK